jgi:hypothetical protein
VPIALNGFFPVGNSNCRCRSFSLDHPRTPGNLPVCTLLLIWRSTVGYTGDLRPVGSGKFIRRQNTHKTACATEKTDNAGNLGEACEQSFRGNLQGA